MIQHASSHHGGLKYKVVFCLLAFIILVGTGASQAWAAPATQVAPTSQQGQTPPAAQPSPATTQPAATPAAATTPAAGTTPAAKPPTQPLPLTDFGYKWIDISLTTQRLVAYQGGRAIFSTL